MTKATRERLGKDVRSRRRPDAGANDGNPAYAGGSERLATLQAEASPIAINEVLHWFITRDDGYLRLIPDGEGKYIYLKFKYTRGRFIGHYAFVSGYPDDAAGLLWRLRAQIDSHYNDTVKPTLDRPYEGR